MKNLLNLFDLKDRVVFITGAAGYLGSSIVRGLCSAGATVVMNDTCGERLDILNKEMKDASYKVLPLNFDITNEDELQKAFATIGNTFGRLDVIINNACVGRTATIDSAQIKDFEEANNIIINTSFRIVQLAKPLLTASASKTCGGASIINIGSMYGVVSPDPSIYGDSGQNNPPFYGAAKAGLIHLTKYLACHLAQNKIRVNAISPGPFPNSSVIKSNLVFHDKLCKKNPMNRIGLPEELIGPVLFLASDASSYVTGINLCVDGGWTAW